LLESEELRFRGEFRLTIPFRDVLGVMAANGDLVVYFGQDRASFALGPLAERWAERIRNPRGLLDKLGVTAGARVALIGGDDDLAALVRQRGAEVVAPEDGELDLLFLFADRSAMLEALSAWGRLIKPAGAIWVVSPKGNPLLRDVDVMAAARTAGLVDTKVASVSPTRTALKLVIPRAQRGPSSAPVTMAESGARRSARLRQHDGA
jgi:hypothetical protein